MRVIKNAEDFGLAFNCMTRLYAREYEEQILEDIVVVANEYIYYFSFRTIICSLRDMVDEHSLWGYREIPAAQKEKYENVLKLLVQHALTIDKRDSRICDEESRIMQLGEEAYFYHRYYMSRDKWTKKSFLDWVLKNALNDEVEHKATSGGFCEDEKLVIEDKNKELFEKACKYMLLYSYGRHSYMPSTCRTFLKQNISLLSEECICDFIAYLQERNPSLEETYKGMAFDGTDDRTWICLQEELELEFLLRK